MTRISEEKIVTVNDVFGELVDLEEKERQALYDVIQALVVAHNLYADDLNTDKKEVEENLKKDGIEDDNFFEYWFMTMLFSIMAWRIGHEQTTQIGYGSLFGVVNQYINGTEEGWIGFAQTVARQREMAETITNFLFGFKDTDSQ